MNHTCDNCKQEYEYEESDKHCVHDGETSDGVVYYDVYIRCPLCGYEEWL